MSRKKKEAKVICPYCESEDTTIREYDTLSVDSKPIKEKEMTCRSCNKRKVI